MRTMSWETAFQIALRNCPKEIGERSIYTHMILVKGKYIESSTYFFRRFLLVTGADVTMKEFSDFLGINVRRCKNWAYKISS